ncbi:hypothetical protein RDWZM_010209 [Blomia tropicalis]|uniref:UDENN domain-containing protein n=1 Tax=Blomia tropicalis TaxID=40697 RepID=A0A9Q0RIG6_BLOTA|nr:hypothetical protein RDWZM_010209 [Blomia tropicalis]
MSYWRNAGLTYLRYSHIAARQVRASLKSDVKKDPQREQYSIRRSDVDYCYPPLDQQKIIDSITDSKFNEDGANDNSEEKRNINTNQSFQLPLSWQTLPSLAIPDGAHNYDQDTVLFHLPSLTEPNQTVYCVACYRQIATKCLKVRTDDMTRSSVQKSVVAILRLPYYGLIEYKLEIVTRAYFGELDFTQTNVLRESYDNINAQMESMLMTVTTAPEVRMVAGLSIRNLFQKYGSQVIILFKLLLLEKKTIFITSPIRELTLSIMSLCSLMPGLIQTGLKQSTIPFSIDGKVLTMYDESAGIQICDTNTTNEHHDHSASITTNNDQQKQENQATISLDEMSMNENDDDDDDDDEDDKDNNDHDIDDVTRERVQSIFSHPHKYYGLPLQLFTCGSYLFPYFSMPYFDLLINERVRSCVAGSSNQIYKQWDGDIDVFVIDDHIDIQDPHLKRLLRPSSEDMNFMSFILRSIEDNCLDSDTPGGQDYPHSAQILCPSQHTFTDGSDEWIRCHFKNYLLHMLRCSFLDENSREYRAFNGSFMTEWKSTHNYKSWSSDSSYSDACLRDIEPQHPFSGNRLSNFRFKVANLFTNRPVELNQSLNKQSLTSALNNAKLTVNSWFSNIGRSTMMNNEQANGEQSGTPSWNTYFGQAINVAQRAIESAANQSQIDQLIRPKKWLNEESNTTIDDDIVNETEKDSFIVYGSNNEPEIDETSV